MKTKEHWLFIIIGCKNSQTLYPTVMMRAATSWKSMKYRQFFMLHSLTAFITAWHAWIYVGKKRNDGTWSSSRHFHWQMWQWVVFLETSRITSRITESTPDLLIRLRTSLICQAENRNHFGIGAEHGVMVEPGTVWFMHKSLHIKTKLNGFTGRQKDDNIQVISKHSSSTLLPCILWNLRL